MDFGRFCDIEFRNISYSASLGWLKGTKAILHGITGKISRGKCVAILGPSGSGKTSLLNILSGYETSGTSGEILVNGNASNFIKFCRISCYISQETHLQPLLTVEEYMKIAIDLQLGSQTPANKVDKVLCLLGLENERESRVAKLSGGEKRRLSIALELVGDREVMFLDEPTTGLDSSSSQQCIKYLKNLSELGMTIICTIHQPTASMFYLFDEVYILTGGECMYGGKTEDLFPFLEEADAPCPISYNAVDYVIEIANGDYGEGLPNKLLQVQKTMKYNNSVMKIMEIIVDDIQWKTPRNSNWNQIRILLRREFIKASRNKTLTFLRLGTSVTNSLILSTIFWKVGSNGATVWFNYNAIMGFILHLMMPSLMLTILTFPSEIKLLQREYFNRWFSLKTYYAAITIADLPISIIYCMVSNVIIYILTDQPREWFRFGMFTSLGFLVIVVAQSLGLLVGAMFNVVNGTFIGSAVSIPMLAFGGFGITFKDMPPYLKWISHFSYLRYGVEGMTGAVTGYNRTKLPCPNDDFCQYSYSQRFLDDLGIQGDIFWTDVIVLTAMFLMLRVITYFALKIKVRATK